MAASSAEIIRIVMSEISNGDVVPGQKLPLITDWDAHYNTASSAYSFLRKLGIVESRGRSGIFVTADGRNIAREFLFADFRRRLQALEADIGYAGMTLEQVQGGTMP